MPFRFCLALFVGLLFSACTTTERTAENAGDAAEDAAGAVTDAAGEAWDAVGDLFSEDPDAEAAALVRPTTAGTAEGTIRFMEMDGGLHVRVSLRGLQPGMHGFHLHQNGACGPADSDGDGRPDPAGAAGDHWDPMATADHGGPDDGMESRHMGDLGNVEVGADGRAEVEMMASDLRVGGDHAVVGRAIIVHMSRDDLETDPSGNSGDPVGCGVIEAR